MNVCGLTVRLPRAAGLALCACSVLVSIQVGLAQTAPVVDSSSVDGSTLTITFSESLTTGSTAVASEFAVKHGEASITVSSAEIDDTVVSLTLTEAVPDIDCSGEHVTIDYIPIGSSLVGISGEPVEPFAHQTVANRTDAAPRIDSIASDASGRYIYVTFCEAIADLSYQWSDFSAFTVSVDGVARPVNDLLRRSDSPNRLDIQLSRRQSITEGESVTLAYDQRRANADYPLADLDQGNLLVESWAARSVTNNVDGPPTLQSVSALYEVVTMTFSEPLDADSIPDASAFTIGGIQHAPLVDDVKVSAQIVTLTLDGVLRSSGSPTYTLNYLEPNQSPLRQLDGAHNVADIFLFQFMSSTPDRPPGVSEAAVDGSLLTITFDLPLKAVAPASAFTISGDDGITVTASAFDGSVVVLTLSPAATVDSSITLSYSVPHLPPRIEARNNRDAAAFSDRPVTNRTSAPVPEFSRAETSEDGTSLTIDFTIPLDPTAQGTPAASSFSLSGTSASVSSVSVSGSSVALGLAPLADVGQAILVSYTPPEGDPDPRLRSLVHQTAVEAFNGQPVANTTDGKPRPLSATAAAGRIEITFDRRLDSQSEPAASTFAISGVAATVADVTIAGKTLILIVDPEITHLDAITVGYTRPSQSPLRREGSSLLVDSFAELMATNSTEDPTPTFRSASVDATGRTLTIAMSHALLATPAGTPAESTFTLSGSTSAEVDSAEINGANVELTLNPAADLHETVSVSYQPPSDAAASALQSLDGEWQTAGWSAQPVTNHADGAPRPVGARGSGHMIVLTFDRDLDENAVPPRTDFSIVPGEIAVSGVAVEDRTVILTMSVALQHDVIAAVTYSAAGTVKLKRAGQALAVSAFDEFDVTNETPEPLLRSIVGDEQAIVVTFSKSLDVTATPAASAFSLGTEQPVVSEVTVNAMTIDLTLARALSEGAEYTLTYTAPSDSALTTSDSSEVPDFSALVANITDVAPRALSATGDGSIVTIRFDQLLDLGSSLTGTTFNVTAALPTTVTTVTSADASLELTLSRPLAEDEPASITYAQPSAGGIADPAGHRTDSFGIAIQNQTDTAPVPVSGTFEGDTIIITLDQDLAAASLFDLDLEDNSVVLDHFTLTGTEAEDIDVIRVVVSNDGPNGAGKIVLTLSRITREGEELTIRYFPDSGAKIIRDDDAGRNRAEINNFRLTNLNDEPPAVESVRVNGIELLVRFDQALDGDSIPNASALSLSNDGPSVSDLSIAEEVLTLTLATTAIEGAAYRLTYIPPESNGLRDLTGNQVVGFTTEVDNRTDYEPSPESIRTDTEGTHVVVVFDQRLDPTVEPRVNWFTLNTSSAELTIRSVDDPDARDLRINLEQDSPVREGSAVMLEYFRESLADGTYNLRDTSTPAHAVESFGPIQVTNLTAAAALGVAFDRLEPEKIQVRFDGALSSPTTDGRSPIAVSVDDMPADVDSVRTDESNVTLKLKNPVPECAAVSLSYIPGDVPLLDIDGREVVAFAFDVENLIDSQWGLRCVQSDRGALRLTFTDLSILDAQGFVWQLVVNDTGQAVQIEQSGPILLLSPASSICVGDIALIRFFSESASERLQEERTIHVAAPCAISASADGVSLSVTFDGLLEGSQAALSDFAISGQAALEAVEGVEEQVLRLRLSAPGLREGEQAQVSYEGDSLVSGELTVGPFVMNVLDATAPPELVSAFALNTSVFLQFDQPLIERSVAGSRFILSGPGIDVHVSSVSLTGSSVYLELSDQLPDDPNQFGLAYLAATRGGLAGLTGSRVPDSVFLVRNFTETPPNVLSAEADSSQVELTFDQEIEPVGALSSDFTVVAGHRSITVASMSWSAESVTLTLDGRVTSLDAVVVRYTPGDGRSVRDRSRQELEPFELRAENLTDAPSSIAERVADAALRSTGGTTTFAHELARGFASRDGIRIHLDRGSGWTRTARGDVQIAVDVSRIGAASARIEVAPIDQYTHLLDQLNVVPASCWSPDASGQFTAWWIGASDRHGVPADHRIRIMLVGVFDPLHTGRVCIMNLATGIWRLHIPGRPVVAPALVLINEIPVPLSADQLPLVG